MVFCIDGLGYMSVIHNFNLTSHQARDKVKHKYLIETLRTMTLRTMKYLKENT